MKGKKKGVMPLVLILAFTISCGVVVGKLEQYYMADVENHAAQDIGGVLPSLPPDPEPEADQSQSEPQPDPLPHDPYVEELRNINYAGLKDENEEVIGWILIPDTELNYPLMQTNNDQYYLAHTWEGHYNSGGSIFMEQMCSPQLTDFNTIIYGHRMNNDSMFGTLKYFREEAFRQEHPLVYVANEQGVYVYEIFAALEPGIRDITYGLGLSKPEHKQAFVDFTQEHNQLSNGIVPSVEDRFVTLSTCTGHGHETRWVVQGRLLREYPMTQP